MEENLHSRPMAGKENRSQPKEEYRVQENQDLILFLLLIDKKTQLEIECYQLFDF